MSNFFTLKNYSPQNSGFLVLLYMVVLYMTIYGSTIYGDLQGMQTADFTVTLLPVKFSSSKFSFTHREDTLDRKDR